jgi:acetolactate synthase I/II/III large subunit
MVIVLREALAVDTVSVIACPVDYSANQARTRAPSELEESPS